MTIIMLVMIYKQLKLIIYNTINKPLHNNTYNYSINNITSKMVVNEADAERAFAAGSQGEPLV